MILNIPSLLITTSLLLRTPLVVSLASPGSGEGFGNPSSQSSSPLFDRFVPTCPADPATIRQFDPTITISKDNEIWVAVFRTFNNKPSVLVRDEFLNAMRSATTEGPAARQSKDSSRSKQNDAFVQKPQSSTVPVAIARLQPQGDGDDTYILDSMRSLLKKEDTDPSCDGSSAGASEHTEALCVAMDALLERYLSSESCFEGAIRTKATLVAAPLLEARGFVPVATLGRDMATHTSSLDACLESYAQRAVSTSISPGARQRAMEIVTGLGRMDRARDLQRAVEREQTAADAEEEEYDPWKNIRNQL